jgi:Zn-dependent protease with chaperone function
VIVTFLGPLVAAAVFGLSARTLARTLRPAFAVPVLSIGGLLAALASFGSLLLVAVAGLGRTSPVASLAHWSPAAMSRANPFSPTIGALAALVLALALLRVAVVAARGGTSLCRAWSTARSSPSGLVVSDDAKPVAYAVPGWPGRVVVSRSLLRALDGPGRRALLAHEEAHLRGRDDLHLFAAQLAAGVNPSLSTLPAAVRTACERRADVSAVRTVGDGRIVAAAIATAVRPELSVGAMFAANSGDVADRVTALLRPPPRRPLAVVLPLALLAVSAACLLWLGHDLDNVTDAAGLLVGRH